MRLVALSLLGLIASSGVAFADTCDNYKTPTQVLAGLSSDDPVAKLGAKTCGLGSNDPVVRGVVIQQLLTNLPIMSFDVNAELKDTVGAQVVNQLPQFGFQQINWNKDGRTFSGIGVPGGPQYIYGQFLGEGLGVTFTNVILQPLKSGGQPQPATNCDATLTLPQNGTQLQGILRCTGIIPRFLINLQL